MPVTRRMMDCMLSNGSQCFTAVCEVTRESSVLTKINRRTLSVAIEASVSLWDRVHKLWEFLITLKQNTSSYMWNQSELLAKRVIEKWNVTVTDHLYDWDTNSKFYLLYIFDFYRKQRYKYHTVVFQLQCYTTFTCSKFPHFESESTFAFCFLYFMHHK